MKKIKTAILLLLLTGLFASISAQGADSTRYLKDLSKPAPETMIRLPGPPPGRK